MSERYDDEFMTDAFDDEAEGLADFYDDEFEDEFEEDEFDEYEDDYLEDESDDEDEYYAFDEYDGFDEFDELDEEEEDALVDAMAYALGAEDTDEFLGKIWKGIKKVGRRALKVARRVVPRVAKMLPGPWGALASTGMRLLKRLRYEGASEEEAMDAFVELAAYDEAAVPVVSALAIKSLGKSKVKRLPKSARKKLVRDITKATKQLIRRSGSKKSLRAIPILVKKVKRQASGRRMPVTAKVKAAKNTINKVSRSKRLTRKLAVRKTPQIIRAKKKLRKAAMGR